MSYPFTSASASDSSTSITTMERKLLNIIVNDREQEVPDDCTIAQLLTILEITSPAVAVELNLEIQPHNQFDKTRLQQSDRLEIVTLVGGG